MQGMNGCTFQARQLLLADIGDCPLASAWSMDGNLLAFGTPAGVIHLFAADRDSCLSRWQAHDAPVLQLRWHPLEALLSSSAQDGTVKHWTLDTAGRPELKASQNVGNRWVEHLAWRPDGRYLAIGAGKELYVHDRGGKLVNDAHFEASTIGALAWSPRGTQLAIGGHQYLFLLSGAAGSLKKRPIQTSSTLLDLRWRADAEVLAACCQDNAVHFWRLKQDRDARMSGFRVKPRGFAWSADSRFLVTAGGPDLTVWDFNDGGPEGTAPHELCFHEGTVSTLAIDPRTGYLAAGGKDYQVSLWRSVTDTQPYYHFSMEAPLEHVLWSGRVGERLLAAADRSGQVGIWSTGGA
jgi:WD40 repeat protein